MKIAAIVLAAGLSRRYGQENKLLKSFAGVPMIRCVVEAIGHASIDQIVVVTGHQNQAIELALSGIAGLQFVYNPEFEKGMSTSIAAGAKALGDVAACLVCLGDLPYLQPADYDKLIELFKREKSGDRIMIPTFRGRKGHPVIFGSLFFAALRNLPATDHGARQIILEHKREVIEVEMDTDGILTDIDFKESQQADDHGV